MRKLKIDLNKKAKLPTATKEDIIQANESVRAYSHILKVNKEKEKLSAKKQEEKEYSKNFWKTAKDITNGKFGEKESVPTYSKAEADHFYKKKYETKTMIDLSDLAWFPEVDKPKIEYNLNPYKPKDIKNALRNKNMTSAPGYDGIVYSYLMKMPSLHKVLATAFTRIRDKGVAPESWGLSKVILIKKNQDDPDNEPTNFRMISLALNMGKLYHTLEAQRTMEFMVGNKYLDPAAQKAYVDGVNGCVEHVVVVQEIIQHAKKNNETMHITWFDLEDAFGSVPHVLIPHVMSYYHLPKSIIAYITSLYSQLRGNVLTKNWETDLFNFLKGVFQGDPYSGVIFLIIFNPIIEYIKKLKETHGYSITTVGKGAKSVITTPFADDFNLITHNKNLHQQLVTDVERKIISMGLVIKPKKCRSLSIVKGKDTEYPILFKRQYKWQRHGYF